MRYERGLAFSSLLIILGVIIVFGGGYYALQKRTAYAPVSDETVFSERQSGYEACLAKCRDTYGGSGSVEFDACVRECGAIGPAQPQ